MSQPFSVPGKRIAQPATSTVNDLRFQDNSASSGWARFGLLKCTGQEDSSRLSTALPDEENHVLPALQAGGHAIEVVLAVDRLLVDLQDYVSALQADVFGERAALNVLHNDSLAGGNVQPVCHILG